MLHRVDDWRTLDGPRFFRLAYRLFAYPGVMQARALAEQRADEHGPPHHAAPSGSQRTGDDAALAMLADGWVERG